MTEYDKRCCCLREIQQTEEKYTDTLGSIQQVRCSDTAPARCMRGSQAGRCTATGVAASDACERPRLSQAGLAASLTASLCLSSSLGFPVIHSVSLSCLPLYASLFCFLWLSVSPDVSLYPCLYLSLYPCLCLSLFYSIFSPSLFEQLY